MKKIIVLVLVLCSEVLLIASCSQEDGKDPLPGSELVTSSDQNDSILACINNYLKAYSRGDFKGAFEFLTDRLQIEIRESGEDWSEYTDTATSNYASILCFWTFEALSIEPGNKPNMVVVFGNLQNSLGYCTEVYFSMMSERGTWRIDDMLSENPLKSTEETTQPEEATSVEEESSTVETASAIVLFDYVDSGNGMWKICYYNLEKRRLLL